MTERRRRTICHVDMDAFYVSVEMVRRPELRGKPVVVGGTGRRGVVAAASYEARRYGVRSAMPSAQAQRLCPDAIFLPGDHAHYSAVSEQVHEIFHSVTPLVEPIALDEAFLDITGALGIFGPAPQVGEHIRTRVHDELQLRCSVGIAHTKFIAKLASEAAKPRVTPSGVRPGRGVVEIRAGDELEFLHPLPVEALWGVGPVTLSKLQRLGVRTVGDLADLGERAVTLALGRAAGRHLLALANAVDDRAVEPSRGYKSIGHEETFANDLFTSAELRNQIVRIADAVAARLRAHDVAARTVTLKLKFASFQLVTRSVTPAAPLSTGPGIVAALTPVLAEIDATPGIRLVGVSGSNLVPPSQQLQLDDLFGPGEADDVESVWSQASDAIDGIRSRFGAGAIRPASALGEPGRSAPERARPWGPDADTDGPTPDDHTVQ